jgi:hypothetical protein
MVAQQRTCNAMRCDALGCNSGNCGAVGMQRCRCREIGDVGESESSDAVHCAPWPLWAMVVVFEDVRFVIADALAGTVGAS